MTRDTDTSFSKLEQEIADEFDTIDNLDEAKRCLKIAYRQSIKMYHGRCIWMGIALIELFVIGFFCGH